MAGSNSAVCTDHLFKVLVIGDVGVGKTSVVLRYVKKSYSDNYKASVGVDFVLKTIQRDPKTIVRLQFWDIAGQDRFRKLSRVYYKEAMGALIVFDITNKRSLKAASEWKQDLDSKVSRDSGGPLPAVLLANKCDLLQQWDREKMAPSLDDFCKDNRFEGWFETSAKDNINIEEAGAFLVKQMMLGESALSEQYHRRDTIRAGQATEAQSVCC